MNFKFRQLLFGSLSSLCFLLVFQTSCNASVLLNAPTFIYSLPQPVAERVAEKVKDTTIRNDAHDAARKLWAFRRCRAQVQKHQAEFGDELITFSTERGLYTAPFELAFSGNVPCLNLYYTTDGSAPNPNSTIYAQGLQITQTTTLRAAAFISDVIQPPIYTQSYLFINDILEQPQSPSGWPTTWGNHRIDIGPHRAGDPVAPDYEMDPEIVNNEVYGPLLPESLQAIPSLSLVTDMDNLDIYFSDPQMRGRESERPVSVEFIDPANGDSIQVNAGVRIQGGVGRWEYMPKHSLRLFFRGSYGAKRFEYPLFKNSPVTNFDTLVLRAGADRSFVGIIGGNEGLDDHRLTTYTRDEWARTTQLAMSNIGSHGTFVHLYLNGLYWGLYNLVERPDTAFAESYLGGDESEWFVANHGGTGDGQPDRFLVMLQLAEAGNLDDPANYATMVEFIDPVQFSDYVILNWFMGNQDWPENNWYANVRYPAGQNLFFVWDAESSWIDGARLRLGPDEVEGAPFPSVAKLVFQALIVNSDFQITFADRLYKHLHHNGALTDDQVQTRWLDIANGLEPAIIAESARWGDARYTNPITLDDWYTARDQVLAQMDGNGERLLSLTQEAGYYPSQAPPRLSQQGGEFIDTLTLSMEADEGTIYYTIDGEDPRQSMTGLVAPTAQRYEAPLLLTTFTTVKARVWDEQSGAWSALNEAIVWRQGQQSDVHITEIMYNPPDGDAYEFVEIRNLGEVDADLSLAYFEGIRYRFPRYATLPAGGCVAFIADFRKFRERYATAEISGIYDGKLSNGGELLALHTVQGEVISAVAYDDKKGWPASANGEGYSLVWDQITDPASPEAWLPSPELHGTPCGMAR